MSNLPTAEQLHNWQCFINDWEMSIRKHKIPDSNMTFGEFDIIKIDVHPIDNEYWVFIDFEYSHNNEALDWHQMKIPFNELINYKNDEG